MYNEYVVVAALARYRLHARLLHIYRPATSYRVSVAYLLSVRTPLRHLYNTSRTSGTMRAPLLEPASGSPQGVRCFVSRTGARYTIFLTPCDSLALAKLLLNNLAYGVLVKVGYLYSIQVCLSTAVM